MNISQLEANFAVRNILHDDENVTLSPIMYISFFLFSETEDSAYYNKMTFANYSMNKGGVWADVKPDKSTASTELIMSDIHIMYDRMVGK